MKTIEEKALEKAEKYYDEDRELRSLDSFYDGYIQGATEALQSQWRSVEEELPEESDEVVVAYKDRITQSIEYAVAWTDRKKQWHSNDDDVNVYGVVAWLPIRKYRAKGGEE